MAGRSRTWSCARHRGARPRSRSPAAPAPTPPSPAGPTSTPRCSTSCGPPASRVHEGHAVHRRRGAPGPRRPRGRGRRARWRPATSIAADGMWSPMRKHLGAAPPGYLGEWHAFRQYFTGRRAAGRPRPLRVVRARPAARLRLVVPAARRPGQRRLRHPARRQGAAHVQDMKDLWPDLLARPHIREVLGPDATPESPHRAWPIPARVDDIVLSTEPHPLRRRRRRRHRPDDRRGHRPGAAHRRAGRRGRSRTARADAARVTAIYDRAVLAALAADHRMSLLLIRALRHRKGARAAVRIAGADRLDPPQLRPLALRGLPPRHRGHAPPLAPRDVLRPRRLPVADRQATGVHRPGDKRSK